MPDDKHLKRAESSLLEQVQTLTPEQQEHVEKVGPGASAAFL